MRRNRIGAAAGAHKAKRSNDGCVEPPVRLVMGALALGMIVGAFVPANTESAEHAGAIIEACLEGDPTPD